MQNKSHLQESEFMRKIQTQLAESKKLLENAPQKQNSLEK